MTNREKHPEAVTPGYHMNKKHWNAVYPNNGLPYQVFFQMVDADYLILEQRIAGTLVAHELI
ncbi:MAG: MmcQ/YjbR family DNA-binding protein [Saprospirales bacterium]|nr:MAG: MmcQ/YjbR family DNA-binding protein [Saprospirales bacterium]